MDYNSRIKILKKMKILSGAKCLNIGRSCNLVWLQFQINESIFCLNIECAFRFIKERTILCSNQEIYVPKKIFLDDSDFNYETFNWDKQGENYFDDWLNSYGTVLKNTIVQKVKLSFLGDMRIKFKNGIKLELFNNSLSECWRFFERKKRNHLVVNGNYIDHNDF